MTRLQNTAIHIVVLTLGWGCAQTAIKTGARDDGRIRNSAYHDGNYPPQTMEPKLWKDGEDVSHNQLYIQSQADYHYTLGEAYSLEGQHKKAIESYRTTLIYDPKSAVVRKSLATEYVKLGVLTEAIEHAEKAVELDSQFVEARLLLAGLYSSLRMYDSAIKQYEIVLQIEPDNTEAPLYIGAVYAEQKKYKEAISYFKKLSDNEKYKSQHLADYYIGRLYVESGGPKSESLAVEAFERSLMKKPDFDESVMGLAGIYKSRQQDDKAKDLLQDWQNRHGPSSTVANALADIYLETEDWDKAYKEMKVIESFSPRDLNIKVRLALVLIEQKRYEEAVGKLEQIISQVPDSDKIRFYLAAVYEELNEFGSAISNYELIPAVSSYYSEAVIHKAYLHKLNGDHDKARKALKEGLGHRKDVPQFYTLYASILDEKSEHAEALTVLKEAVERFPGHVQIRFFLGSMYDKNGDLQSTLREMEKVLEMDTQHVQAMNYLAYTYAENRMDLKRAEQLARNALELEPEDGYILDTLGWILFKQGRMEEAITVLELAYSKQKSESVIAEHLGDAYYSFELPEKAKKMYVIAAQRETDEGKLEKIKEKIIAIENQKPLQLRQPASIEVR